MRLLVRSAAVLMTAAASALAAGGNAPAPAGSTGDHTLSIGVVNVIRITQQMHERGKIEEDLRAQNMQLAQEQQKREQEVKDLIGKRDQYKPGSGQWQDATKAIDQKSVELDVWVQVNKQQLDRRRNEAVKALYDHISAAAATIAQQQHLNLVIADQSGEIGPDVGRIPPDRLQQALASRAVLYADKKADITEDVLTLVEANFMKSNNQLGAAGNQPPK